MRKLLRSKFQLLPEWIKEPIRKTRFFLRYLPYQGKKHWCPICGSFSRKFGTFGIPPRKDARCIFCGALERHRFAWLFLINMTDLFDGRPKTVLHVAPEACFESRFREHLGNNYITADLYKPNVMVKMDITDIHYPADSFDVIFCSHVFEHVPDDKKAMREFHRVLKPSGWATLLVPITSEKTFEDPTIIDSSERFRIFGQPDHVRRYGPDYVDRLKESGFKVAITHVFDLFDKEEITRMALSPASGEIYYCTK